VDSGDSGDKGAGDDVGRRVEIRFLEFRRRLIVGKTAIMTNAGVFLLGRAKRSDGTDSLRWLKASGDPVSCVEKIKVLNENYAELQALALDALEDALILGCSAEQFRRILHEMIDGLQTSVTESPE
jgi:hypothetical protein